MQPNPLPNQLSMNINNNSGSPIIIESLFAQWVKSTSAQKLDQLFLNGVSIWNTSDPDSPSNIPAEGGGNWPSTNSERTIPAGTSGNFIIHFMDPLEPTGYQVQLVFDVGCPVNGSK
jgi:hypothetical protein